jgi:integration host factor subunit alpha
MKQCAAALACRYLTPARLVAQVLEEITARLGRGETVNFSSFGSFIVRQKGERIGRIPRPGKPAPISARRVLVFKPSRILKRGVSSPAARESEQRLLARCAGLWRR